MHNRKYFVKKYPSLSDYLASRSCFPRPNPYYKEQFPELQSGETEWVSVKCCFHEDKNPSLRVNLKEGHFRCFACGAKGGNIIAFHAQRYNLSFRRAIKALRGKLC